MCNIALKNKKKIEAREYLSCLNTVYIVCYIIFYLYVINHHGTSLKNNPYSRCNPVADRICILSVAMIYEQEENSFKDDFVKQETWKIAKFSSFDFSLFYGKIIAVRLKEKSVAISQMFLVTFMKMLGRVVWILKPKVCTFF